MAFHGYFCSFTPSKKVFGTGGQANLLVLLLTKLQMSDLALTHPKTHFADQEI